MLKVVNARWITKHKINQSFQDSLSLFYQRIPRSEYHNRYFMSSCIDDLLRNVSRYDDIDWCIVHSDGVIYNDQSSITKIFIDHIETLDPDTLITGQLIDKEGFYCGIHEQCFAVNMKTYRKLGLPLFGNYEDGHYDLVSYQAGPSLHDDYTPRWVKPGGGEVKRCRVWTCGWSFVNQSIKNGLSVENLPNEVRDQKIFAYPSDELDKLNKNIEAVFSIEPTDNISQNRMILYLLSKKLGLGNRVGKAQFSYEKRKGSVFAFNTEQLQTDPIWVDKHLRKLDKYFGPCSGLLEFANLCSFGFDDHTSIHYYDINEDSLNYKKEFWETFDGGIEDLLSYANTYKENNKNILIDTRNGQSNIDQLKVILDSRSTNFDSLITRLRKLPKIFHKINLLTNYSDVLSLVGSEEVVFLSYSDIFLGQNELLYGLHELKLKYRAFLEQASKKGNLIIQGKNMSDIPNIGYAKEFEALGW